MKQHTTSQLPKTKDTASGQKQFSLHVAQPAPLMEFLAAKLPDYSRTARKQLLVHHQLFLNGVTLLTQFDYPLQAGDRVDVRSARGGDGQALSHPKLKILFEDDYIIVVEKKEGLLSVRTAQSEEESASHLLNQYLRPGGRRYHIFVVHRLDKDTSGVMMFAKTMDVQHRLRDQWTQLVKERSYVAVADGKFEKSDDQIVSYLTEDAHQVMHSSLKDNGGQHAITHYRVLKQGSKCALLKLNLETGRKNQIRVHLQSIGHSVLGDKKYGGPDSPAKRLCLHAETLKFEHPVTGKLMAFSVPSPAIFTKLTEK